MATRQVRRWGFEGALLAAGLVVCGGVSLLTHPAPPPERGRIARASDVDMRAIDDGSRGSRFECATRLDDPDSSDATDDDSDDGTGALVPAGPSLASDCGQNSTLSATNLASPLEQARTDHALRGPPRAGHSTVTSDYHLDSHTPRDRSAADRWKASEPAGSNPDSADDDSDTDDGMAALSAASARQVAARVPGDLIVPAFNFLFTLASDGQSLRAPPPVVLRTTSHPSTWPISV